ncbi:hypothetical protein ACFOPN_02280 [Xanthomonas hyacinthi]
MRSCSAMVWPLQGCSPRLPMHATMLPLPAIAAAVPRRQAQPAKIGRFPA